jgi:hypothetical protein
MAQLTACDNCEKTTKDDRLWWRLDMDDAYRLTEFGWPEPPYQFCSWKCVAEYAAKREQAAGANRRGVGYRGRAEASDG